MSQSPLLITLSGQVSSRRPVWFYRQAGRYLPEYRQLRNRSKGFLDFCLNPLLATEATLQPVRRFDIDAAILFADILLVPYGLGKQPCFRKGEKPSLSPVCQEKDLDTLHWNMTRLGAVFETLERVKISLPGHIALIGFAGSPWTIAAYMLNGSSGNGFRTALEAISSDPVFVERLIAVITEATVDYLARQIEAGAGVLQLFDSWAGLLHGHEFRQFVIEPTRLIVNRLRRKYPSVPVIGFPRGAAPDDYRLYAVETGVGALALDQHVSLFCLRSLNEDGYLLQGNVDPWLLVEGGGRMRQAIRNIGVVLGAGHIMNLGHGILPQTPPEHVEEFIRDVRLQDLQDENGCCSS